MEIVSIFANGNEWNQYFATDNALRQELFTSVPEIYLATLRNTVTGYSRITTKQALNHLYSVYGRISPHDYELNDKRMKMAYNANEPFELFVQKIESTVRLADAASKPYSPEQVEQTGYMLLERTGVFTDECKLWRRRPANSKNWSQMKFSFLKLTEILWNRDRQRKKAVITIREIFYRLFHLLKKMLFNVILRWPFLTWLQLQR